MSSSDTLRPHVRVERAVEFILRVRDESRDRQDLRLPSIRRLATACGVSPVTMWKAVATLREQGVLTGAPGCRPHFVELSSDAIHTLTTEHSVGKAQRALRDRIRADVYAGVFPSASRLPSAKDLCRRYGCSPRALREAVDALCGERVIRRNGRALDVPRVSSAPSRARVVVLVHGEYLHRYLLGAPEGQDYLSHIERVASQKGMRAQIETYHHTDEVMRLDHESRVVGADTIGYLYLCDFARGNHQLLSRIAQSNKPMSIIARDLMIDLPASLDKTSCVRIFPAGSSQRPGEVVARYLLGLGHRAVAYISPYHSYTWSLARLAGLQKVYREGGLPDGVVACTLTTAEWTASGDAVDAPATEAAGPKAVTKAQGNETKAVDDLARSIATHVSQMRVSVDRLMRQAVADPRITAWITANDEVGAIATTFLQRRHIAVPGRVSLVSFDNSIAATAHRLTSYDLDLNAIVNGALNHIAGMHTPTASARGRIVEIDGTVVERDTTGPATSR